MFLFWLWMYTSKNWTEHNYRVNCWEKQKPTAPYAPKKVDIETCVNGRRVLQYIGSRRFWRYKKTGRKTQEKKRRKEKTSWQIFIIMSIVSVSKLDIFGKQSAQTRIQHTTEKDHYPISGMIESRPLDLKLTESWDEYIDLSSAYLHLTASISVGGITNPAEDSPER